jgi:hypothetical protein
MIPFTFVLSIFENYFIGTNLVNNDDQLEKEYFYFYLNIQIKKPVHFRK